MVQLTRHDCKLWPHSLKFDLMQIKHAHKYKKQHANGILEIFRKTTLPISGTVPSLQHLKLVDCAIVK